MGYDEVQVFVFLSDRCCILSCHSLLVEGMEDRLALYSRESADSGSSVKLVHHYRVSDICRTSAFLGNLVGDECAEVAGMFVCGVDQVLLHLFVYQINAALQWTEQSAASDYSVELHLDVLLLEELEDEIPAVFILVDDVMELCQFVDWQVCSAVPYWFAVLVDGKFCRSRTRVDC